jgi:NACHT domain
MMVADLWWIASDQDEEAKNSQCLRDLRSTDPRDDKIRIERSKDDLLKDSYIWILNDPAFTDWRDKDDSQLLWIKGDPGKGKTMLMIGLIKELSRQLESEPGSGILSYFFCQSTDSRLNNAVSVLRGLIYLLVSQQRTLIQHLRKRYDTAGQRFFEDTNTFYALSAILSDMLHDSTSIARVYLMVDALDECDSELPQLLDLIARNSSEPSRVKWLVSSRNRPDIEEWLRPDGLRVKISLELKSCHISQAVNAFIDFKVQELVKHHDYDIELREEVRAHLSRNAEGTFLWVALVCKELRRVPPWETQSALEGFPPKLEPLYERMMNQIQQNNDKNTVQLCQKILSLVTLAFRPLYLRELGATTDLPKRLSTNRRWLNQLVDLCGSFLTVREETVYFIHQSAKDYFSTGKGARIFPSGQAEEHCKIAFRSLQAMSDTLKKDICGLQMPGALLEEVESINQDPLAHIRYACCYWVNHLRDASYLSHNEIDLCDSGKVHIFFQEHFLHWLEALSLTGNMSNGIVMVRTLESILTVSDSENYTIVLVAN